MQVYIQIVIALFVKSYQLYQNPIFIFAWMSWRIFLHVLPASDDIAQKNTIWPESTRLYNPKGVIICRMYFFQYSLTKRLRNRQKFVKHNFSHISSQYFRSLLFVYDVHSSEAYMAGRDLFSLFFSFLSISVRTCSISEYSVIHGRCELAFGFEAYFELYRVAQK